MTEKPSGYRKPKPKAERVAVVSAPVGAYQSPEGEMYIRWKEVGYMMRSKVTGKTYIKLDLLPARAPSTSSTIFGGLFFMVDKEGIVGDFAPSSDFVFKPPQKIRGVDGRGRD